MERIPPNDKNAEISVLGSVMIDREALNSVLEILKLGDFYYPEHKEIYEAIIELESSLQPVDIVTGSNCLQKRQSLEAAGGLAYLAELSDSVPTSANAVEYAKVVREKSLYRSLISISSEIANGAFKQETDAINMLDYAEERICSLAKEPVRQFFYYICAKR